jgi:hypothetical protein
MMEDSELSDTFYLPPVMFALSKDKQSSIFGKDPTVAITGWGWYRTDVPGMQDKSKPAIRNYTAIATSIKTFGPADVEGAAHSSLIEDWDNTIKLLDEAQRTAWDFTAATPQALDIVNNVDPHSTAKLKLVQHFAVESEINPSLTFSEFMHEKSKYTNVIQHMQDNLAGNCVFKLVAPIQIYLDPSEQGSRQIESSTNDAARVISQKMQYNTVKVFFNNVVRTLHRIHYV